jgi:lipid-A-disaccharide synthase
MSANIFISAGEASGEHYGTQLIAAIKAQAAARNLAEPSFFGMGGERMAAAGCERIVKSEDVAVMGITEVVRHLPQIYREFRRLKSAIRERAGENQGVGAAILIDFPDINLKLAEEFHRIGIPVIYFVSPQLWAWKKHRIKQVQKFISHMLVIFPFEEPFYKSHKVDAEFVGHPLADEPLPNITRAEFAAANSLDPSATWLALLPGSRIKEIRANLPEILRAAKLLVVDRGQSQQKFEFLIPLAATLTPAQRAYTQSLTQLHGAGLAIHLLDDARTALFHARASIVASGTATVEAALMGNPFVVVYRVSPLTYAIAKRVVQVPHVAMVNLIAEKRLVPELIQSDFKAETIVQSLAPLLPEGPARASMMEGLKSVRQKLERKEASPGRPASSAKSAIERVAEITLDTVAGSAARASNGMN